MTISIACFLIDSTSVRLHPCEATAAGEEMCFVSARDARSQESLSPNRCEARGDRDIHSPQHQLASRNISSGLSNTRGIGDNGFYVQQFATIRLWYRGIPQYFVCYGLYSSRSLTIRC